MELNHKELTALEDQWLEKNKMIVFKLKSDCFVLGSKGNKDYLDYHFAKDKTSRLPLMKGQDKTILCLPKGTIFYTINHYGMETEEVRDAVLRATKPLTKENIVVDGNSRKRNDICIEDGRKVSGTATYGQDYGPEGFLQSGGWVTNKEPANLLSKVIFPDEYSQRKGFKKAEERAATLNIGYKEFRSNLVEEIQKEVPEIELQSKKPELKDLDKYKVFK
jgi:hypothetical protein